MSRSLTEQFCWAVVFLGVVSGALGSAGLFTEALSVGWVASGLFLAAVWTWVSYGEFSTYER